MSYRDRRKNFPPVKPVTKIELSEKNVTLRVIAIVVLLAIAITALGVGLTGLLSVDSGWQVIEASSQNINCSADFSLNYYLGASDVSPTAENKLINSIYTEATENAYRIFSAEVLEEGLGNVGYLNAHVNETVTVEPALYDALALISAYENRYGFLAPAHVEYDRVFLAEDDATASRYDPALNPDVMAYVSQAAAYAADPAMVDIQLMGEGQVCLYVSDGYLAFAEEYGIETFFDFGWMTNAFIADYIAGVLAEKGFTLGYLSSYDGFTRNLDPVGMDYSFNIFDRKENTVYLPAAMHYSGALSIVSLRDYPMGDRDRWHYYAYEDGTITTAFLDPTDGVSKSSAANIVSYSETVGCAEILMQTAPVFIADSFDAAALNELTGAGIFSIWCEDTTVCYNQQDLDLTMTEEEVAVQYNAAYAG